MTNQVFGLQPRRSCRRYTRYVAWAARLQWLLIALAPWLPINMVLGDEYQSALEMTTAEKAVSEVLVDTPYINTLLIHREFPIIGGSWGSEIFVDTPLNSEPDGAQVTLRRAKLKYVRNFGNHWRLKLTGNYTRGGGLELNDNYFSYNGWNRALLTLGVNDPPFSLESISSSSALTFMERGLPVEALSERRSGGVTFLRRNPKSILNASLILFNVSQDNLREAGQGLVLHYVHSPIEYDKDRSVHLGGSFSYRINANEESTRFRSRPEIATVNDYFVDTGAVANADQVGRFSLEVNQVRGRFSWQTELLAARIYRTNEGAVDFWGAYVFASWFLTGESRNYNFGHGSFDQININSPFLEGGPGAFEVGVRASHIDLTNKNVVGGRETNLSVGLNWYANKRIRLMTNLVKVLDVDRPGSAYDGQHPLIFSLRVQWVLN